MCVWCDPVYTNTLSADRQTAHGTSLWNLIQLFVARSEGRVRKQPRAGINDASRAHKEPQKSWSHLGIHPFSVEILRPFSVEIPNLFSKGIRQCSASPSSPSLASVFWAASRWCPPALWCSTQTPLRSGQVWRASASRWARVRMSYLSTAAARTSPLTHRR